MKPVRPPGGVASRPSPWWKGARGEWFVFAQVILMALVFFGPRTVAGLGAGAFPFANACALLGAALMAGGGGLLVAGLLRMGRALTPLPYPRDEAQLIQSGPFALVRHPMYGGGVILAFGWALWVQSWFTLTYAVVLFAFLDMKSRREERWLAERFPAYPAYRRRVRKLIPFLY